MHQRQAAVPDSSCLTAGAEGHRPQHRRKRGHFAEDISAGRFIAAGKGEWSHADLKTTGQEASDGGGGASGAELLDAAFDQAGHVGNGRYGGVVREIAEQVLKGRNRHLGTVRQPGRNGIGRSIAGSVGHFADDISGGVLMPTENELQGGIVKLPQVDI